MIYLLSKQSFLFRLMLLMNMFGILNWHITKRFLLQIRDGRHTPKVLGELLDNLLSFGARINPFELGVECEGTT